MIRYSVLDLAPIVVGGDATRAFRNSRDLARHAEAWGYHRYWLAEHHNMTGIASSATAVLIGYVAEATSTLRVGAGGVMLPNHAPLVVAEQFGTLAAMYPGRIDLGIGRAPGTDPLTARALRRHLGGVESFPDDLIELLGYLGDPDPGQLVRAVPGAGSHVPVWLLGSSLYSARLAAQLGLPFSFASHFAPDYLQAALEVYREEFQPSPFLDRPRTMAAMNAFAADTDEEAQRLFTSVQQQFLALRRGDPGPLRPPVDRIDCTPEEAAALHRTLLYSAVGSPGRVRDAIRAFVEATGVDEVIFTGQIYDHAARLRSFEIVAEVCRELGFAAIG